MFSNQNALNSGTYHRFKFTVSTTNEPFFEKNLSTTKKHSQNVVKIFYKTNFTTSRRFLFRMFLPFFFYKCSHWIISMNFCQFISFHFSRCWSAYVIIGMITPFSITLKICNTNIFFCLRFVNY